MNTTLVHGKNLIPLPAAELQQRLRGYQAIHLDIGTGDGAFVYKSAQAQPEAFFIGIDPCIDQLLPYAGKIYRKPAKGGLSNAIYLRESLETLPEALNGQISTIHLNYPWAALLKYFIEADPLLIATLRRVARPGACCDVLLNFGLFEDKILVERLNLPQVTMAYLTDELARRYSAAGLTVSLMEKIEDGGVPYKTSWGQHLTKNSKRSSVLIRMSITS
jgi:16S rRNA (adenine(1408)-N(1))-methyltransferase